MAKLLFLSDLHLDINSRAKNNDLIKPLINFLLDAAPDYLIISGDIGNDAHYVLNVLEDIELETNIKVLFIPGNHDIWSTEGSSDKKYDQLKEHRSSLIDKPFSIGNEFVVIGDMGWYDYSFGIDGLNFDDYEGQKYFYWNDGKYASWIKSDRELCAEMIDKLKEQLNNAIDKKVIFVNHFIPFENYLITKNNYIWNLCNAYMGSSELGKLIDQFSNIQFVVFGHTHKRFPLKNRKGKKIICRPLGYTEEWITTDFYKELADCAVILEA